MEGASAIRRGYQSEGVDLYNSSQPLPERTSAGSFPRDYDEVAAERIIATNGNQETAIDLAQVEAAMAMLPQDQRQALHMMAIGGLTTEEIAERMGTPAGTVKSRVSRARTALKVLLTSQPSSVATLTRISAPGANQLTLAKKSRGKVTVRPLLIG